MKRLFSPWRKDYIEGNTKVEGCIFCNALKEEDGAQNLILHRGARAIVMLNLYPYTNGHVIVAPVAHQPSLEFLDSETRAEMMELVTQTINVLKEIYNPHGFNVGANIGKAAGAGVPDHVHLHVLPRWNGDTNFMATVGATRVLPETIEETYKRIKQAWK